AAAFGVERLAHRYRAAAALHHEARENRDDARMLRRHDRARLQRMLPHDRADGLRHRQQLDATILADVLVTQGNLAARPLRRRNFRRRWKSRHNRHRWGILTRWLGWLRRSAKASPTCRAPCGWCGKARLAVRSAWPR